MLHAYFLIDHPKVPEIDLAFGLSATAVNKEENFKKMKDIISGIVDKYGQGKIRYAVINIGKIPESLVLEFSDDFPTDDSLKKYLTEVRLSIDPPFLDKALDAAKRLFDASSRPNSKKVFVIITDKKSNSIPELVTKKAKTLGNTGVSIIPVALGGESNVEELEKTTLKKENVIKVNDSATPKRVAEEIMDKAVQGKKIVASWYCDRENTKFRLE